MRIRATLAVIAKYLVTPRVHNSHSHTNNLLHVVPRENIEGMVGLSPLDDVADKQINQPQSASNKRHEQME